MCSDVDIFALCKLTLRCFLHFPYMVCLTGHVTTSCRGSLEPGLSIDLFVFAAIALIHISGLPYRKQYINENYHLLNSKDTPLFGDRLVLRDKLAWDSLLLYSECWDFEKEKSEKVRKSKTGPASNLRQAKQSLQFVGNRTKSLRGFRSKTRSFRGFSSYKNKSKLFNLTVQYNAQ